MFRHKRAALVAALLIPSLALAQVSGSQAITGSVGCTAVMQAAANGMTSRIAADNQTIQQPQSVTTLSCLNNFFSGTGLDVVTNLLNPLNLLQHVEAQICGAVQSTWNQFLSGATQCGITLTGINFGFGGLGGGLSCPKLTFGGGGPPIGSIGIGNGGAGSGRYINGTITAPPGYTLPPTQQGTF